MPEIGTSKSYAPVDLDGICQNYREDVAGTARPAGNRFAALRACAAALNHLLARACCRVLYAHIGGHADPNYVTPDTDQDPAYQWKMNDNNANARTWDYRVLALPVDGESGVSYLQRDGSTGDNARTNNAPDANGDSYGIPEALYQDDFTYSRGAAADAEITEGVTINDTYQMHSLIVQEQPLANLDTDTHEHVEVRGSPGDAILSNHLQSLCTTFHTLRATQLPVLAWWCAEKSRASPGSWLINTSASGDGVIDGDRFGISCKTSSALTNVIDQTSTSRTATTAGLLCPRQYAGRGPLSKEFGQQIKVQCRVLASANSATGWVRFEGPDSFTNNYTDLSAISGTTVQWYGTSSNFIYLDASSLDTDTTTERNKVDIFGKISSFTEFEELRIFGWVLWMEYL